jgi:hypothetical protein
LTFCSSVDPQEVAAARVEAEVDQRVELMLRDRRGHGAVHTGYRGGEIGSQQRLGLELAEGLAGVHFGAGVAIADGPHAAGVLVGGQSQAFKTLRECKSIGAVTEVAHVVDLLLEHGSIAVAGVAVKPGRIQRRYSHIQ